MKEFYVFVESVETSKKVYHFVGAIGYTPPNDKNCIQYRLLLKSLEVDHDKRVLTNYPHRLTRIVVGRHPHGFYTRATVLVSRRETTRKYS